MESKDLKKVLGKIAADNGYSTAHGIWYKESTDCIFTLSLQKSNFGNYFYLNLKIFIRGIFGKEYKIDKALKNDVGDIFRRSPKEYDQYLDFDIELADDSRISSIKKLFQEFINPFVENALKIEGIFELEKSGEVFLLPAVKGELTKLKS